MTESPPKKSPRKLIEGKPVLLVIDIQQMALAPRPPGAREVAMPGFAERMRNVPPLIAAARRHEVPIIYFQEVHRPSLIDFGRELDGTEGVHCLENDPLTAIATEVDMRPDDYVIRKRRYSCFFGTELEILLKGLKADTLLLTGGFTDVCVHYTFVDAHQNDYFCRVVEDCVAGSSLPAHDASLRAMEYLQTGARRMSVDVMRALEDRSTS
jgi:nicotinamidase-related amidase